MRRRLVKEPLPLTLGEQSHEPHSVSLGLGVLQPLAPLALPWTVASGWRWGGLTP